jgi:hypothetical protein
MDKPASHPQDPLVLMASTVSGVIALRSVCSFLFLPVPDRMPPLIIFLLLSFLSLGIFEVLSGVRRRRILDLTISLAGITLSGLGVVRWIFKDSASEGWIPPLEGFLDWYAFCLIVLSVGIHWLLGIACSRMDTSHTRILLRFDSGIGVMLFIAFLRWGIKLEDPYAFHTAALYVLFGLIALYRAKRRELEDPFHHSKSILRSIGTFLALGSLSLGVALLSFPLLTQSADRVYRTAHALLSPLMPYVKRLLKFLLGFTFARPAEPFTSSAAPRQDLPPAGEEPPWVQLLGKLLSWGSLGVLGLLGLVLLGFLLKLLIQALLQSRGEGKPFSLVLKQLFHEMILHIRAFFRRILDRFRQFRRSVRNARTVHTSPRFSFLDPSLRGFYRELIRSLRSLHRVGRVFGIKRLPSETLRQYVGRIGVRYPRLKQPGEGIQEVVELFSYGPYSELSERKGEPLPLKELIVARRALQTQFIVTLCTRTFRKFKECFCILCKTWNRAGRNQFLIKNN